MLYLFSYILMLYFFCVVCTFVFFFKQKTAYEMRISDWSSDVCSSDLVQASIVMRRDLRDGNTYRAYVADYPELNDQVRMLGRALQPHGPANFQFRTDADGTPCVFEINARDRKSTRLNSSH